MNVVNRAIAIVVLVILIVVSAISLLLALVRPEASIAAVARLVASMQSNLSLTNRLSFAIVAALALIASALLLWLEVRRPQARNIQVQEVTGGDARVSIESIVQRLEHNIGRLQDISGVKPVVAGRGNGVEVMLNLQTAPEIDVPMKTEEVIQVAKDVVENQMGLKLQKVGVEIRHAPYSEDGIL